jgi:hypothetical protein
VVDVEDGERVAEAVEEIKEGDRIGPAGDGHADAGACGRHVIKENSLSNPFDEHPYPF